MGRRKNKVEILEDIAITGIADKGKAVGRHGDRVVFVEGAVPGDIVNVRVRKRRKKYKEGIVEELKKPSEDRIEAFCEHFGECGGCKWQNLTYEAQLRHKQQIVVDAMTRIAKVEIGEILPIVRANKTQYHRNKVEFTFSNRRWLTVEEIQSETEFSNRKALGFHRPGGYNRIVDINECFLQAEPSNSIRNELRAFAIENNYDFYDIKEHVGYLRNVVIRVFTTGEVMLILSLKYEDEKRRKKLLDHLLQKFPQITSLHYVINPKLNDFILDLDIKCYKGRGFAYEYLRDIKFKIGPKSFFQTNTEQAVVLYDKIVEFAEFDGTENVYDLYTGIGSIACYVSKYCKQVVGIEEVELAIVDAEENAKINEIDNAVFYAGDVKDILTTEFADKHGKPDLIITDPPRAGMHPKVVQMLVQLAAPKMVYVSCNPATQARDFEILKEVYDIIKVQPVDMFPHTHHIEDVALLKLKEK